MTLNKSYNHDPVLRIVVASTSFAKSSILCDELKRFFPNTHFNNTGKHLSEPELINFLEDADAAIIGTEPITEKILAQTPKLKIISKYGVGLDNIDHTALEKRNITLGWTGGVNRRSVSELTLCFMLGLCRNIFAAGFELKQSRWKKNGGYQLSDKTIGIIGCGYIGSDVVRLLSPFACKILVQDIVDKSYFCREQGAAMATLEKLIERSDIITLHVPLTELTRNMVDENFLKQMKSNAFLINTCRGDVVNQNALKNALKQRTIGGAALDVFAEEPPTDRELLSLPNIMVTPHIGGNARESVQAMGRSAIEHLITFFKTK